MANAAGSPQDTRQQKDYGALSHPGVEKVFELSRSVGNEAHIFLEFVRFRELQNHVLYARIEQRIRF